MWIETGLLGRGGEGTGCLVHHVHFEGEMLAVYCVFGGGVEVELEEVEPVLLCVSRVKSKGKIGGGRGGIRFPVNNGRGVRPGHHDFNCTS